MDQNIKFGSDAQKEILEGVETLHRAVSATLGPKGKLVVIEKEESPFIHLTKDGITVARSLNLKNKFHKIGCETIKNASEKTVTEVGDGTTSTIVLAYNIFKDGLKLLNSGYSAVELKEGMDYALEETIKNLKLQSKPIENRADIKNIAKISSNNNEEIGELVATALEHCGNDGVAIIERSNSLNSSVEFIEGLQIDRGFISPYFITNNEKMTCELNNPLIFISTKKLASVEDCVPMLEASLKGSKNLLIIAEEIEGQFLHTLITNKNKGIINVCAIVAPGLGEMKFHLCEDIATITGGQFITSASGFDMSKPDISKFGKCDKVIVGRYNTTFIGGKGDKPLIKERIDNIRTQLIDPTLDLQEKNWLRARLAKLSDGVSIIKVGGATEIEIKEKFDRFEDALCASKSSLSEGVVSGGGTSYIRASSDISPPAGSTRGFEMGIGMVKNACSSVLKKIISNGEIHSPEVVLNEVLKLPLNYGMNYVNGTYCNLLDCGIIDPTAVVIAALRNSISAASLLLFVDVAIVLD